MVFTDQPACNASDIRMMSQVDDLSAGPATGSDLATLRWELTDPIALKFTSGSTGTPKCLAATASSVNSSIGRVQELFAHGPNDNLFVFLPLSLLQQRYWVYSALAFGHDVTISTSEAALVTMARVQPTVVMGVPAFFEAAQRHVEREADRRTAGRSNQQTIEDAAHALFGRRIRYLWTGSAPASPATLAFFNRCGLPIYEGYGMNETCIITKNAPGAAKPGSVGRPLPGKRVTIDGDGVVNVISDFPVATRYEYASPGESERIFRPDGVVRTGDLGHLDEDGFLFLHGRADDVIVLGNGRKVVVGPIEEFMKRNSAVAQCVLFCPNESHIVAVVSAARQPPDVEAIHRQAALSNTTFGHDEQIKKVVVAREPFTISNDLLTSQCKPRRGQILEAYRSEINDIRKGTHVH
jgi:long-subunit acyl-CoA synthetase (AMP-forming)